MKRVGHFNLGLKLFSYGNEILSKKQSLHDTDKFMAPRKTGTFKALPNETKLTACLKIGHFRSSSKNPYSFELWLSQLAISSENDILFSFIYALRPKNFFHI